MKKKILYRVLFGAALLLAAGFCVLVAVDAAAYDSAANSAPFWLFVLVRVLEFLLPGLVSLCAAVLLRRKFAKSSGRSK